MKVKIPSLGTFEGKLYTDKSGESYCSIDTFEQLFANLPDETIKSFCQLNIELINKKYDSLVKDTFEPYFYDFETEVKNNHLCYNIGYGETKYIILTDFFSLYLRENSAICLSEVIHNVTMIVEKYDVVEI